MDVLDSKLLKSLTSHEIIQQMSLILSRCLHQATYFYWTAFVANNLITCLSHELKSHPTVSQLDSIKIELPLDIPEEQRHFLNNLTTVMVAHSAWNSVLEWPMQGVAFRSKGSVRGDRGTTFSWKIVKHWGPQHAQDQGISLHNT